MTRPFLSSDNDSAAGAMHTEGIGRGLTLPQNAVTLSEYVTGSGWHRSYYRGSRSNAGRIQPMPGRQAGKAVAQAGGGGGTMTVAR
ncbi:hypothetical protein [Tatumella terrea]|uniref:Uncharacterized protein n=1 Tax=Tatumella terrea TaxID=419007 RepID=A0ABW1VX81_9GAMM